MRTTGSCWKVGSSVMWNFWSEVRRRFASKVTLPWWLPALIGSVVASDRHGSNGISIWKRFLKVPILKCVMRDIHWHWMPSIL